MVFSAIEDNLSPSKFSGQYCQSRQNQGETWTGKNEENYADKEQGGADGGCDRPAKWVWQLLPVIFDPQKFESLTQEASNKSSGPC